jgi:hypothetical protein
LITIPKKEDMILAISNFIRKYKFIQNIYLEVGSVSDFEEEAAVGGVVEEAAVADVVEEAVGDDVEEGVGDDLEEAVGDADKEAVGDVVDDALPRVDVKKGDEDSKS